MDEIIQVNPLVFGGESESVHANVLTTLWENPNPSASFTAQNITLASGDYDFTRWIFGTGSETARVSVDCEKGKSVLLSAALTNSTYGTTNIQRNAAFSSDTVYNVGAGSIGRPGSAATTDNTVCKPLAVYGLKKSLDITAIVSNVSTDASKCMLSDGVTSVQQQFDKTKVITQTLNNATGYTEFTYPTGFNGSNCVVIAFEVEQNTGIWRTIAGISTSYSRTFVEMTNSNIQVYNNNADNYNKNCRIALMKYQ